MTEFEIEKDIPAPTVPSVKKYPWAAMNIGDSFFTKATSMHSAVRARNLLHKDTNFIARRVDGGYRVWRIK